jgi:hypothetical protein
MVRFTVQFVLDQSLYQSNGIQPVAPCKTGSRESKSNKIMKCSDKQERKQTNFMPVDLV